MVAAMRARSLSLGLVGLLMLGCPRGRSEPDDRQSVAAFHASLKPLVSAFEASEESSQCDVAGIRQQSESTLWAYDIAVLKGLAEGRQLDSEVPLRMTAALLRPIDKLGSADLPRAGRLARESIALKGLAVVYRVKSLVRPVVTGNDPSAPNAFSRGSVSMSAVLITYPEGKALCPFEFEAESSLQVKTRRIEGTETFAGPMEDLVANADRALSRRLQSISPALR